jgi:hypothetical protein
VVSAAGAARVHDAVRLKSCAMFVSALELQNTMAEDMGALTALRLDWVLQLETWPGSCVC